MTAWFEAAWSEAWVRAERGVAARQGVIRGAVLMLAILLAAGLSAQEQPGESETRPAGEIAGSVLDPSAAPLAGALVTLERPGSGDRRSTVTDDAGAFRFPALTAGTYKITIAAPGFTAWNAPNVSVLDDGKPASVSATLELAPVATNVNVGLTAREVAAEQLKTEEKQRLFHLFPNYFVTYAANPAPLTAAQKFQLGWKSVIDPVEIFTDAGIAGVEQARGAYHQFGLGLEGYGKRFGAQYADDVNGTIIGGVLMQSVFHQDPRYFYKGTGTLRSRLLYVLATAFVRKGDNGHWQADYSDALGAVAAGEISTLYYPASSRVGLRMFHIVLATYGSNIGGNLFSEFVSRRLTSHAPKPALAPSRPLLRAGTPVTLISIEPLDSKATQDAGAIGFVVTDDLKADGVVMIKAGSKASGQVRYSVGAGADGPALHVKLEHVTIESGQAEIPLRSTPVRGSADPLQFRRLEDSGRISVVLYVDENTPLSAVQ